MSEMVSTLIFGHAGLRCTQTDVFGQREAGRAASTEDTVLLVTLCIERLRKRLILTPKAVERAL